MPALRVLTWNLNGLDTTRLDERMERACMELVLGMDLRDAMAGRPSPPTPDVLCLQEVVRRAHLAKLRPHLAAAGFTLHPDTPPREDGEYVLIAVRAPIRVLEERYTRFEESPLARGWLELVIEREGERARVLTAHMESLRSGKDARVAQALEIDARLRASEVPAVFAGDTNLREDEVERAVEEGFASKDAFVEAKRPRAHRETWWPEHGERGLRFDRIWLDPKSAFAVDAFRTRRRAALSDHAAVEARLVF